MHPPCLSPPTIFAMCTCKLLLSLLSKSQPPQPSQHLLSAKSSSTAPGSARRCVEPKILTSCLYASQNEKVARVRLLDRDICTTAATKARKRGRGSARAASHCFLQRYRPSHWTYRMLDDTAAIASCCLKAVGSPHLPHSSTLKELKTGLHFLG